MGFSKPFDALRRAVAWSGLSAGFIGLFIPVSTAGRVVGGIGEIQQDS